MVHTHHAHELAEEAWVTFKVPDTFSVVVFIVVAVFCVYQLVSYLVERRTRGK